MSYSSQYLRVIAGRRQWATLLTVVGLILLAVFLASEYFGIAAVDIGPGIAYSSAGLGLLAGAGVYRIWRCPECGAWPGQLTARVCSSCGLRLTDDPSEDLSARVDREQVRTGFKAVVAELAALQRWRPLALIIGIVSGSGLVIFFNGIPSSIVDWLGLLAISAAIGFGFRSGWHNLTLLMVWRCPACRRWLPLNSGLSPSEIDSCQHCGVKFSEEV